MADINTHHMKIGFGRNKGELYTRLPISYLRWMVNVSSQEHEIAKAELDRRGYTDMPPLEVSGHAIDSASLRCLAAWKKVQKNNVTREGLHAWLIRMSKEVLEAVTLDSQSRYIHVGAKLVMIFEQDGQWPILKTVFMAKNKQIKQAKEKNHG